MFCEQEFSHVAVVSVGEREPREDQERIDLLRENVRSAAASEFLCHMIRNGSVCVFTDHILPVMNCVKL